MTVEPDFDQGLPCLLFCQAFVWIPILITNILFKILTLIMVKFIGLQTNLMSFTRQFDFYDVIYHVQPYNI